MAKYERTETEDAILVMMHQGAAPSLIDAKLKLAPGEARYTLVEMWKKDKRNPHKGVLI